MTSPLDIRTPALQRLYADWESRRRDRDFPARADFDIADLTYVIGSIVLFDFDRTTLRFRFRLHGSRIAQHVGYDMTGKELGDLPEPRLREQARAHFLKVIEARAPRVEIRERQIAKNDRIVDSEVLVLPLARDGTTIDMLMVGVWFP